MALLNAVSGATVFGARALLVDAISDRAAGFYRRFGFEPSPIHVHQLFTSLADIEVSAGLS